MVTTLKRMIARETYFNLLASYIDKPFIKIITGLRRSGKSVLLNLLSNELINRGIDAANIMLINFESFEFSEIDDAGKRRLPCLACRRLFR